MSSQRRSRAAKASSSRPQRAACQSSSACAAAHASSAVISPRAKASAMSPAAERHHRVEGGQSQRIETGDGAIDGSERRHVLLDMDDALGERETRAERGLGSGEDRAPEQLLGVDQRLRPFRPIEKEVAAGVADYILADRGHLRRHAVDRRVDEPGERHAARVDLLDLGVPLGGQRLGQRQLRHRQVLPCGRPRQAPIESDGEPGLVRPPRPPCRSAWAAPAWRAAARIPSRSRCRSSPSPGTAGP